MMVRAAARSAAVRRRVVQLFPASATRAKPGKQDSAPALGGQDGGAGYFKASCD